MSSTRIFVAGFGGQGVLLIGQMLAYAGMEEDKEVTWMPSYGPEMRGGTANCTVNISDKEISSPLSAKCDVLVAMNGPSLVKFEEMVETGGNLFVNSTIVKEKPKRNDINVYYVDCFKLAHEIVGNDKTQNMVMLGAIMCVTNVVKLDTMKNVFAKVLTGNKAKLVPDNITALSAFATQ